MISEVEDWEAAEQRRQMPGKRRLVEHISEGSSTLPKETTEMGPDGDTEPNERTVMVSRYPVVDLPGVGEICPFGDTANFVMRKITSKIPSSTDSLSNLSTDEDMLEQGTVSMALLAVNPSHKTTTPGALTETTPYLEVGSTDSQSLHLFFAQNRVEMGNEEEPLVNSCKKAVSSNHPLALERSKSGKVIKGQVGPIPMSTSPLEASSNMLSLNLGQLKSAGCGIDSRRGSVGLLKETRLGSESTLMGPVLKLGLDPHFREGMDGSSLELSNQPTTGSYSTPQHQIASEESIPLQIDLSNRLSNDLIQEPLPSDQGAIAQSSTPTPRGASLRETDFSGATRGAVFSGTLDCHINSVSYAHLLNHDRGPSVSDSPATELSNTGELKQDLAMAAYSGLLGSQAERMMSPSTNLWSTGLSVLTGAATKDKFMREPTLFNPILEIEDFRSMESDSGKKGKHLMGC